MTDNTENGEARTEASQTENFEGKTITMEELPAVLRAASLRMNWTELMPVQEQTIPYMLDGLDVMVQSRTGSGKTGAFLLPILNRIEPDLGAPQALVLVPTRELAVQVTREAEELGKECGVRPVSIYGGVGYKPQIQGLESGSQLVIGTPGRILDHLLKGTLNLDRLKVLIFDEADRMLSMGFYPDMKQLQRYLPRGLQSSMFSATYPGHVKRLAQQFLKDPVFVSLSAEQVHVSEVLHVVYKVPAMQKSRILVKIIEQENPASAIIFCNTKSDVHFVATVLRRFGYDVGEISADLTQAAREEVLEKLRLNRLKFLVATDVAARGIDIHELSHVFQYQPPQDHEAYVHRTGRTGRAGAAGVAISFVSGMEEIELEQIAKKFSIPMIEHQIPDDAELETLISQRAVFLLEARLRKADNIQKERMQRFMRTVGELAANEDSRALLAMLVDEFYQATFHAPLEQPSERMVDMVKPVPPVARPAMAEDGRSDGEKRRRKRPRKKPSNGGDAASREQSHPAEAQSAARAPEPEVQAEPVASQAPAAEVPSGDVAPRPESRDEETSPAVSEETGDAPTPAPKKRRRRRPRKSSAQKAETASEGAAEQGGAAESGSPESAASVESPAGKEGASDAKPSRGGKAARPGRRKPSDKPSEKPADRPSEKSGEKPEEKPAAPAKPKKKKIFLE
jgi:ATP-dependent RNA helicase DeaD